MLVGARTTLRFVDATGADVAYDAAPASSEMAWWTPREPLVVGMEYRIENAGGGAPLVSFVVEGEPDVTPPVVTGATITAWQSCGGIDSIDLRTSVTDESSMVAIVRRDDFEDPLVIPLGQRDCWWGAGGSTHDAHVTIVDLAGNVAEEVTVYDVQPMGSSCAVSAPGTPVRGDWMFAIVVGLGLVRGARRRRSR